MKSITEQIEDLARENSRLNGLKKLFEKAVKNEFGIDAKNIHKIINNYEKTEGFEKEIISFFHLKTQQDFDDFIAVFCTSNSLEYFRNRRHKDSLNEADQQG